MTVSPLTHMKYMLLGGAGLAAIALVLGVPLQDALFIGILLACPLMMVFMMGGHGEAHDHRQGHHKESGPQDDREAPSSRM